MNVLLQLEPESRCRKACTGAWRQWMEASRVDRRGREMKPGSGTEGRSYPSGPICPDLCRFSVLQFCWYRSKEPHKSGLGFTWGKSKYPLPLRWPPAASYVSPNQLVCPYWCRLALHPCCYIPEESCCDSNLTFSMSSFSMQLELQIVPLTGRCTRRSWTIKVFSKDVPSLTLLILEGSKSKIYFKNSTTNYTGHLS